jgi:hypothetical protein
VATPTANIDNGQVDGVPYLGRSGGWGNGVEPVTSSSRSNVDNVLASRFTQLTVRLVSADVG